MTKAKSTQSTHSPVQPFPSITPAPHGDFAEWAALVRQQMLASLQKRGAGK